MMRLVRKPPPPSVQMGIIRKSVIDRAKRVLDLHIENRNKVLVNWETEHEFDKEIEPEPGKIRFRVFVEADPAESASVTVWHLISGGTAVRFAQMSGDFKPQTTPNLLSSRPKQGSVVAIDTNQPHEGIDPREYDIDINTALTPNFEAQLDLGFREGGKRI